MLWDYCPAPFPQTSMPAGQRWPPRATRPFDVGCSANSPFGFEQHLCSQPRSPSSASSSSVTFPTRGSIHLFIHALCSVPPLPPIASRSAPPGCIAELCAGYLFPSPPPERNHPQLSAWCARSSVQTPDLSWYAPSIILLASLVPLILLTINTFCQGHLIITQGTREAASQGWAGRWGRTVMSARVPAGCADAGQGMKTGRDTFALGEPLGMPRGANGKLLEQYLQGSTQAGQGETQEGVSLLHENGG